MEYELFYLIAASKEAGLDKIKAGVEEIVKKSGGNFSEKTTLEKRKLSYTIKHENHGIYIARRFDLEDGEQIQEITKKLNLFEDILRFVISKAEDLPELKSKEERMEEASKNQNRDRKKEKGKKPIPKKEATPAKEEKEELKTESKPEEKTETKKEGGEDIDKKLEEILNI